MILPTIHISQERNMKKFREYLNEEMMPFAQTEKGFVGVDNGPVRDNINIHLASITAKPYATPYHAMEMVRKVLAPFSIFPPHMNFLDGDSGHEVFEINQFGDKMGMTNDGIVVVKNADPYFLYFEYAMNDRGGFDIFCEIVTEDELSEIMADIEDEMEDGNTTTGDMEDAEDSFDEYKSENQIKEDKDPCWDTHEMVGMKMKGGRKVPYCVPVEEEKLDEVRLGGKRKKNPNNETSTKSQKDIEKAMNDSYGKVADSTGHKRMRQLQKGRIAFNLGMMLKHRDANKPK
jgi:hypothetical protein